MWNWITKVIGEVMILPKDILPLFYKWVGTSYGVKVHIHDPVRKDELARWLISTAIFIVRKHDVEDADTVEVWCSNGEKLEEMERLFVMTLRNVAQEKGNLKNE